MLQEFRFNELKIVRKLGQGSFAQACGGTGRCVVSALCACGICISWRPHCEYSLLKAEALLLLVTALDQPSPSCNSQVFLGYWHQTPVAAKILLAGLPPAASSYGGSSGSGGGGGASSILTAEAAAAALSLPASVLAKLEEEARLLASLRHPAIANFLGFSRMPACLITEYCQRGSLMQVLEAAAKDPASAAELPWQRRLSMASACNCCCAGWLSGRWPAAAAAAAWVPGACALPPSESADDMPICTPPPNLTCSCWMRQLACCTFTPDQAPSSTGAQLSTF